MKKSTVPIVLLLLAAASIVPLHVAGAREGATATDGEATIPVVIWQVSRPGALPAKNAWMVGTDAMFRLTYDDGANWYAFKPVFADSDKGFLAVRAFQGEGAADGGEQEWTEKAAVTVVQGRPASVQIGDGAPFSIEILEFKTVSARDLKQPGSHTGEAGDSSSG
jgi:hypothetical protein